MPDAAYAKGQRAELAQRFGLPAKLQHSAVGAVRGSQPGKGPLIGRLTMPVMQLQPTQPCRAVSQHYRIGQGG